MLACLKPYRPNGIWLSDFIPHIFTGLATGSSGIDYGLKKNGFPGEGWANSSVLVVKTHRQGSLERNKFKRAILLVRDPLDSMLAEFNRKYGGHNGHAQKSQFEQCKHM